MHEDILSGSFSTCLKERASFASCDADNMMHAHNANKLLFKSIHLSKEVQSVTDHTVSHEKKIINKI